MGFGITVFIILIVCMVILVYSSIKAEKKLTQFLTSSFGKPPEDTDCELDSIRRYAQYKAKTGGELRIDDITWNDLDMDKVFGRINVCLTSIGEEYLYNCMQEPQFEISGFSKREKLIKYLEEHSGERLLLQKCLAKLGKRNYNGLSSLIYHARDKQLRNPAVYTVMAFVPLFCAALLFINIQVGVICVFLSYAVNLVVYYKVNRQIEIEVPTLKYFSTILYFCKKLLKIKTINELPSFTDLKNNYEVFKQAEGKISVKNAQHTNEIAALLGVFIEYYKILSLYDIRKYNKLIKRIIKYNKEFGALYQAIGEIDLSLCVLSFRHSLSVFSTPDFIEKNITDFTDIYHPLIPNPVTNSGTFGNNCLITGSNASGKSTFIKALAVNGILAQTIFTCAAKGFRTRLSLVVTSMALRDNISGGDSYFIIEIKSLKRILDLYWFTLQILTKLFKLA